LTFIFFRGAETTNQIWIDGNPSRKNGDDLGMVDPIALQKHLPILFGKGMMDMDGNPQSHVEARTMKRSRRNSKNGC
jgi:hypothetical protein